MSDKIKVSIDVIHDLKNRIGVKNDWGYLYQVDQDSIMGDQVYDAIYDSIEGINPWDDGTKDWHRIINNSLENCGFDLIPKDPECAERLKKFCKEFYGEKFGIHNLDFQIVYYDSLEDVEMGKIEKAVIY